MKKKGLVALIYMGVLVLIIGSFALTAVTKNISFILFTCGLFFVLAILSLLLYFRRFHKEYERQEKMDTDEVIEEINDLGNNRLEYDVQQVKAVVDTWKQSSIRDRIKGILFVAFFIGCLIAFVVCLSLGYEIYGFIFFGLGVGEILLALIVVKLLETHSLKLKKGRKYYETTALVLGTSLSSQSLTGTKRNVRIGNTTYKVFLRIKGNKVTTYSKEYYNTGEKVKVSVDEKNPKKVHIIGLQEDIFENEDQEF